jgi:hypothetical protein
VCSSDLALDTYPIHVTINNEKINELAETIQNSEKIDFYSLELDQQQPINRYHNNGVYIEVIKELIANSVNYCYWYGASSIKPSSSTMLYTDIDSIFNNATVSALIIERRIENLIRLMAMHRYPMLEERRRHLFELAPKAEKIAEFIIQHHEDNQEACFGLLVDELSGFASDMFLKRASLFFMQLYRKFKWFNKLAYLLPVPVDYQLPKVLRYFDVIRYTDKLSQKIFDSKLIPKHSLEEIQIRAATIKACNQLKALTNWNSVDIDTYLW